ncbi:Detected protein of unknown function [Hibiscus syriacus]|uniref:Uncharacterized protein n=1 Tax=Hibiscus syriacus TaxID=106335 RepID=A0A6A2Z4B8_HIBSY|nr:Detected protein of unknown function [Hibiscus syriacus]
MFAEMEQVLHLHKNDTRIVPEDIIFCSVMKIYGWAKLHECALKLLDEIPQYRCPRTVKSMNSLLLALLLSRKFDEMKELLPEDAFRWALRWITIGCSDVFTENAVLKEASRLYAASWVRDIGPYLPPNDYKKDDEIEGKPNGDKSRTKVTKPSTLEDIGKEIYSAEKFSLEISDNYLKQVLGKKWRDHKSSLKKKYFKKDLSLEEKLQTVPPGMLRYENMLVLLADNNKSLLTQLDRRTLLENTSGCKVGRIKLFDMTHTKKDDTPMTNEAAEIVEKLRDKRAEYEATTSSHGIVNADEIENQVINEFLGPEGYGQVHMSSQSQSSQLEVSRLKQQLVEMDQKVAQMKAETEAREAERVVAYQKKCEDFKNRIQAMMQMI